MKNETNLDFIQRCNQHSNVPFYLQIYQEQTQN